MIGNDFIIGSIVGNADATPSIIVVNLICIHRVIFRCNNYAILWIVIDVIEGDIVIIGISYHTVLGIVVYVIWKNGIISCIGGEINSGAIVVVQMIEGYII